MNSLVSLQRRRIHVGTELLAVAIAVPMLWSIAAAPRLTDSHRSFLRLLAVGTLLVDGWLLLQWKRDTRSLQDTLQQREGERVAPPV